MVIDFGTGDGSFVQYVARQRPEVLVIGVDANGEGLRATSQRAGAKPTRGGVPNAVFGRLTLDDAPGSLAGIADELTVLLPWGTLLGAIALGDPLALTRLRNLGKHGAKGMGVRVVFGYGPGDPVEALGLRDAGEAGFGEWIEGRYREADLEVKARRLDVADVRALPTTWAKKLAYGGKQRAYWELLSGR